MSNKEKILSKILVALIILFGFIGLNIKVKAEEKSSNSDFIYLSDIEFVRNQSSVGWREVTSDKTPDNTNLSVKVEGAAYTFEKGIFAHATSTVVYDLRNYSEYDFFTAYLGLNTTSTRGDGVQFDVLTSVDGLVYESKMPDGPLDKKPGEDATFVKIDISDANYLKLVADDKASNAADHSVYADAKLIKRTYIEPGDDLVPSIEELDERIKAIVDSTRNLEELENNSEYEYLLLKRELVKNAGNFALKKFLKESPENQEAFRWLIGNENNHENLKLYVLGGLPDGNSYYNSLTILAKLYKEYASDFNNTQLLGNPTTPSMTYGHLYKKMAMSISLTHSQLVGLWMQSSIEVNKAEPLRRYAIFRYLHKNGWMKITDSMDMTHLFEDLHIQEMRMVVSNNIDDEEILWLNRYVQDNVDRNPNNVWRYTTPHPYIAYVWPNYANPVYYAEENVSYFNELFAINKTANNVGKELANSQGKVGIFDSEFVIPGGATIPEYRLKVSRSSAGESMICKVWMNFRNKFGTGCVCGGISKSGANIRGTHGIPAGVIGQPGHAALLFYSKDEKGRGFWRIDNDVSGWTLSGGGGRLLRWGSGTYTQGFSNGVYVELEQAAINDYQNLMKAQKLVMLAKVYAGDVTKQEEIYRKALEIQSINFDAWLGLIETYKANSNKTEDNYYDLAEEVSENLKYYPLPMYNATNLIKQKITSIENNYRFTLLQTRTLTEAKNLPNNTADSFTVVQPGVARLEAGYILGQFDSTIATFSFDGEDAGKIVLASRFDGNGVRWDYCINGDTQNKASWKEISFSAEEEHKLQLSDQELASLTAENDIYIHIVGVNYSEENLYKIDIKESAGLPATLYANDLENKLLGTIPTIKWQMKGDSTWNYYGEKEPDLTGNKTIVLKAGATGTFLEGTTAIECTFTEDVIVEERKYIPIAHLSVHDVSTEATAQGRQATNAIDGNLNTNWHSAWNGSDTQKYIVIKLDEVKNLTALEYFPQDGGNGKILSAQVLVSLDGENWTEVVSGTNWTYQNSNDVSMKSLDFDPVKAQYIKIVGQRTQNSFIAARMFNFYEDTTAKIAGTFSFDGINKNQIVIDDEFIKRDWEYSLNGGTTWKAGEGKQYTLSADEIEQVNENYKIKLRFSGSAKEYIINIKNQEPPTISAYINDWENRLIGITNTAQFEWRIVSAEGNSTDWKLYSEEEPIVRGNSTLQIRKKASGITKASDAVEFNFTADTDTEKQTYIPIRHLSIANKSSESSGELANYAIDGNNATMWHTNHSAGNGQDERFIVIKLDEPRYISKVQYMKKDQYRFGILKNGIISTSMDGENWEDVVTVTDLYNPTTLNELLAMENIKDIPFAESKQAQYVKIKWTKSCDYTSLSTADFFATAAMINLYEDMTKVERIEAPTAEVEYSTSELTNGDVTARLVNESTEITVTNNNGSKTHTFTENGTFTFEFEDRRGTRGTATATVSCIDKVAPTATVTYNTRELTNEAVVATLTNKSEEITITNNDGNDTYTFTENGTFTFNFRDAAGNTGTATANVTWIMTADQNYEELKEEIIRTIQEYKSKATEEEINNKLTNKEEKKKVIEAYNKLKNDDKAEYKTFIDRVIAGGKPIITLVEANYTVKYGTKMNLYDFITIRDNEDGVIKSSEKNVKIKTKLDTKVPGTYSVEYEVTDSDKNVSKASIQIIVLELQIPTAKIEYSTREQTSEDVIATLVNPSTEITILNNNGSNKYTFKRNGEFTFRFVDSAGNEGETVAKVTWIDKNIPTGIITYDIENKTNRDVTATLTVVPGVKITNNEGMNTHVFTTNGEFTFELESATGVRGTVKAKVDWIKKDKPVGTVNYNIKTETAENVVATLEIPEGVTVTNNNGKNTYTFTKNEEFTFEFIDEYGNTGTALAKVTWINKDAPTGTISYDIEDETNKDVTATLTVPSEITITNNNGKNTYTFTKNGEFVFEFVNTAGTKGTATAKVTWIDKDIPTAEIRYSTQDETKEPVVATLVNESEEITITNNDGKNTYTFTENGEFIFEFVDKVGNKGTAAAKVDWIKEESEQYILGDVNRDGKIGSTDLLLLKRHIISENKPEWVLSDDKIESGDLNKDGKITTTDVLLLKRLILAQLEKTQI